VSSEIRGKLDDVAKDKQYYTDPVLRKNFRHVCIAARLGLAEKLRCP
jgi:hypothetical protein